MSVADPASGEVLTMKSTTAEKVLQTKRAIGYKATTDQHNNKANDAI
jgi:hypothetical protein